MYWKIHPPRPERLPEGNLEGFDLPIITFISHHAMDGYNNDKNRWTVKTLVGEAVYSDSPEATKERYPTAHR